MRMTEQKVYQRGSCKIRKVYRTHSSRGGSHSLLVILVVLVALFLLSSSLVFARTMSDMQSKRLPRELPALNDLYFRELLESSATSSADWRALRSGTIKTEEE